MCRCTKIGKILNFQNADGITHYLPVRFKPSCFLKDCLDTYCICRYIISPILSHRISQDLKMCKTGLIPLADAVAQ